MKKILTLFMIIGMGCSLGCQTISKTETVSSRPVAEPVVKKKTPSNPLAKLTGNHIPKGQADSIVAIWKDASYTVAGQQPTRGFGGRLYFYDSNKNPVVVDGELVVYGFNDKNKGIDQKPDKRFIFTQEELQAHMSVSSAGPSYSIWLPWDHVKGEEKMVTLLALFKDAKTNRVSTSEQIAAVLPGTKPVLQQETDNLIDEIHRIETERGTAKPVGFNENKPEGTKKIRSHEIKVPRGSKERLFGNVPTASYQLPKPQVTQASATEPIASSPNSQPSTSSSPDPRQAQSGQFVRQGKLPPGKKPPQLGVKSFPGVRQ